MAGGHREPLLADLLPPLARSGQGYLFPLLCYLARQVWTSPRAMQLVHLLLAGAAAFAFARWAPLGRRERALFLLGYFPFYEYAVISRHYATGALLVWLACAGARGRRPALALGAELGLLCQTTVYGYILALALAAGWLLDRWLRRRELPPLPRWEAAAGLVLALGGFVAGLVQLIPAPGTSFAPGWRFGWDAAQAVQTLGCSATESRRRRRSRSSWAGRSTPLRGASSSPVRTGVPGSGSSASGRCAVPPGSWPGGRPGTSSLS